MNENPTIAEPIEAVGATTPPPPLPPTMPVRPPLLRSRTDRMLGGVCGGLGRYFDVDPVLIRILVVVLTVFSGGTFGIAYLLAWFFIKDEPLWAPVPMPAGSVPASYAAGGTGTFVDPATGQVYGAYATPAPVAVRTEPRSYLGLITLSAAVLVGGLLWVLGVSGISVPGVVVAASMLGVLGIGLLVGAFRGRAKWLIAPAVVLLLIAQAATLVPRIVSDTAGSGVGDRRWTPTTSTASFELGAGDAVLDLGSLPVGASSISASVGVGQLRVLVPADIRVVLVGSVGIGEIDLPRSPHQSGNNVKVERTFEPLGTSTTIPVTTVELTAQVGLGQLEVRRATS